MSYCCSCKKDDGDIETHCDINDGVDVDDDDDDEWWWFGLDHHDSTTYNVLVVTSFGSRNPDKVEDLHDTKNEEMADDERKIQLQPYER